MCGSSKGRGKDMLLLISLYSMYFFHHFSIPNYLKSSHKLSSTSSILTSSVASCCEWLFFFMFLTSIHKACNQNGFNFASHTNQAAARLFSAARLIVGEEPWPSVAFCLMLCFESCSLHGRSKQWTTQDAPVWHTLSFSVSLDLSCAGENSNHCADSTHQTKNIWVMYKVWLKDEIILNTFCYICCFLPFHFLYFSMYLPIQIDCCLFVLPNYHTLQLLSKLNEPQMLDSTLLAFSPSTFLDFVFHCW